MLINLTQHDIVLRAADGSDTTIKPSGAVARVASTPGAINGHYAGVPVYDAPTWGAVEGLPDPVGGTGYIVSGLVASRCADRVDVYSPGTGPADGAVRNDAGQIVAVTRLISAAAGGAK